jgi:hypothetical protein
MTKHPKFLKLFDRFQFLSGFRISITNVLRQNASVTIYFQVAPPPRSADAALHQLVD